MITIAELIDFLKQFPAETAVEIVHGNDGPLGMDYSSRDLELPAQAFDGSDALFETHVQYYRPISVAPTLLLGHDG